MGGYSVKDDDPEGIGVGVVPLNEKQIQIILGYQNDIQDKKIKKTHLMKKLELDHNIQISLGTLNKIMNNEY